MLSNSLAKIIGLGNAQGIQGIEAISVANNQKAAKTISEASNTQSVQTASEASNTLTIPSNTQAIQDIQTIAQVEPKIPNLYEEKENIIRNAYRKSLKQGKKDYINEWDKKNILFAATDVLKTILSLFGTINPILGGIYSAISALPDLLIYPMKFVYALSLSKKNTPTRVEAAVISLASLVLLVTSTFSGILGLPITGGLVIGLAALGTFHALWRVGLAIKNRLFTDKEKALEDQLTNEKEKFYTKLSKNPSLVNILEKYRNHTALSIEESKQAKEIIELDHKITNDTNKFRKLNGRIADKAHSLAKKGAVLSAAILFQTAAAPVGTGILMGVLVYMVADYFFSPLKKLGNFLFGNPFTSLAHHAPIPDIKNEMNKNIVSPTLQQDATKLTTSRVMEVITNPNATANDIANSEANVTAKNADVNAIANSEANVTAKNADIHANANPDVNATANATTNANDQGKENLISNVNDDAKDNINNKNENDAQVKGTVINNENDDTQVKDTVINNENDKPLSPKPQLKKISYKDALMANMGALSLIKKIAADTKSPADNNAAAVTKTNQENASASIHYARSSCCS